MLRLSVVLLLSLAALLALFAAVEAMPQGSSGGQEGQQPPVLGANKCTWGPSYWCANHANAKECETTTWCVEKKMLAAQ